MADAVAWATVQGYNDDLRLAHVMADAADDLTMRRFKAVDLKVETKPDLTPVSDADRAVEEAIRGTLRRARPRDAVVGEEFGKTGWGARSWIIDPIDGTKNYVRGVPVWATLIALMEYGRVVVGLVSAPRAGPPLVGRDRGRGVDGQEPDQGVPHAGVLDLLPGGRVVLVLELRRLGEDRQAGQLPRPEPRLLADPRVR
ncbi:hypothetical protein GCM10020001_030470 [Nonomuraea salmonea]